MTTILTLVAADTNIPVTKKHLKQLRKVAEFYNISFDKKETWLAKGKAVDLQTDTKPQKALLKHLREEFKGDKFDVFVSPVVGRKKKLLLADMDSTIVAEETLDELAAYAGIKDEIAAITKKAMEGHLDFHEALRARVKLLEGLDSSKIQETLEATQINPGARELVATMRESGATCILVSGGFTFFTSAIASEVGFQHNHGNTLHIKNDKLTGTVGEPIQDKHSKLNYLRRYCEDLGLDDTAVMTIGDGANDLPMLKAAGFGVGYHPKPLLIEELDNVILHGDLSAALYAQGYTQAEIKNALKEAA